MSINNTRAEVPANPRLPNGLRISDLVDTLLTTQDYLSDEQKKLLGDTFLPFADLSKASLPPLPDTPSSAPVDASQNIEALLAEEFSYISPAEEVIAVARTLKMLRLGMQSEGTKAPSIAVVKGVQAITTALATIKKLLPDLQGAEQIMALQTAIADFSKTLPEAYRKKFMARIRNAVSSQFTVE